MIEQMRVKRIAEQEKRNMEMLKSLAETVPAQTQEDSVFTDYCVLSFAAVCWIAFIVFYNFY